LEHDPVAPFDPYPSSDVLSEFLTNGANGLNLGTGLANIPSGSPITFQVPGGLNVSAADDGVPDIMITQIANPSSTADKLWFEDGSGNRIGDQVAINQDLIGTIARKPPTDKSLTANYYHIPDGEVKGFTSLTSSDVRIATFTISDFGIPAENLSDVELMVWLPGGTSDPAFFAYNTDSFTAAGSSTVIGSATTTLDPIGNSFVEDPVTATATNSENLTVVFSSATQGVCTVDASTGAITLLAAGECTISATQASVTVGGTLYPSSRDTQSFTVSDGEEQTITFDEQSDTKVGSTLTLISSASSGLPVTWVSNDTSVCTVTEGGVVTTLITGVCSITSSQSGGLQNGTQYAQAVAVTRTFDVVDTRLRGLAGSTPNLATAFAETPGAPTYTVNVAHSATSYTVTPTAEDVSVVIEVNGVAVTSGEVSAPIPLSVGANQISVSITAGSLTEVTNVSVVRAPAPATVNQLRRERQTPPPSPAPAPLDSRFSIPASVGALPSQPPSPIGGPVSGQVSVVRPDVPVATVNGMPQAVQTQRIGSTGIRLNTGKISVGIEAPTASAGRVVQSLSGSPELSVVRGQSTGLSGSGLLPFSTVQVFLGFNEFDLEELSRAPVDANGTFSVEAAFQTPGSNVPLPIGRQVLQLVSVDEDGNQTFVDLAINIAQPSPQPELLRDNGETPTLAPGQLLATQAGEIVAVELVPVPENKQTIIDGGDWTMEIVAVGDGSGVIETDDGGVAVEFIRDESALVSGSGFLPLTRADVWFFSTPTLLGTVDIDANGEFTGEVNVDGRVVSVGEHTLQLQGIGPDGYTRSANLGVIVNDARGEFEETNPTSFHWLLLLGLLLLILVVSIFWLVTRFRMTLRPEKDLAG